MPFLTTPTRLSPLPDFTIFEAEMWLSIGSVGTADFTTGSPRFFFANLCYGSLRPSYEQYESKKQHLSLV